MGRALLIFTMVGTFCLNGLLPAVFCKAQAQETGAIAVDALQCEYAANPLGIDAPQPRFTWTLKSLQRGQVQTAYQVVVARTEQTLHGDAGDMWDSGKVTSDRSVNVVYDGKPLSSGEKCWWKVRVWDKAGRPSGWSEPATFEMGLLNESDWQGQWITIADNTAPLLRKEIVIDKAVRSARVYFAGLGFSELYVNGEKVGDDVLSPALTDYFEQIQYMTYDLTDVLKPTANALGVMLGNGYFSAPLTDWKNPWGDRPQLLLQLNIQYADGTQASIVSDTSWKAARAPIEGNSIDYGEVYDARKERPGWCAAGYDDADWQPAVEGKSPGGRLTSQTMPAMRVIETIKPIRLTNPQPAVYVYEFDRLFGGWARLHVKGPAGGQVRIAYSTRLLATGLIDKEPWPGDQVTDFYTLKGDPAGEFYEPRFTFHPVQYVQITGLPGTPTLDDLEGRCVYTAEDMSGTFECSNPLFNRIHSNMIRTLQNALKGFLLDCMHREPIGYNEPASMSASLFTRKHMPRFWTKFAEDSRLAVAPDGSVSDIAPIFPGAAGRQPDVAQSVSYPMMIRYLYQCYDDRRLLENHYPAIKRWTDYIGREMCEGPIVVKGWLGDHMLPGNAPGYEKWLSDETPPSLIWTALYYRNLQITSEMAGVLGKTSDAREYAVLAERVKRAFNDTWLDAATSHYGSKSQTSEILPLALGLVPEENRAQLIGNIRQTITETDKGHLRVGHVGLVALSESLVENGVADVMYGIVNQTTYPGWGYMVANGATTIWESWGRDWATPGGRRRADSMTMLGSVDRFFYNHLAGIQGPTFFGPEIMQPGFKEFRIQPHVLDDMQYARAEVTTVRGAIRSAWQRAAGTFELCVEIPVNCRATICIPKCGLTHVTVTEKGTAVYQDARFLKTIPGITAGNETRDYVILTVGSGSYTFRLEEDRSTDTSATECHSCVTRSNRRLIESYGRWCLHSLPGRSEEMHHSPFPSSHFPPTTSGARLLG